MGMLTIQIYNKRLIGLSRFWDKGLKVFRPESL
jgi:hypothetical protein